jgi:hypothetical protein
MSSAFATCYTGQEVTEAFNLISVSGPYSFDTDTDPDPDPALRLNTDPDPFRIQGIDEQKLKKCGDI